MRKKSKIFMLTGMVMIMLISVMMIPTYASAAGLVNRSTGLGDLFLLDKLFNSSSNDVLNSGRTSLGDLFILDKLFPVETVAVASTVSLASKLSGRILIQTEENGEAWYVNPSDLKRYYLDDPGKAFNVMAQSAVGISNENFDSFDENIPTNLFGRFVIKTEDAGKMYYVNRDGSGVVYVGNPTDAMNLIKAIGLGITNSDISTISIGS